MRVVTASTGTVTVMVLEPPFSPQEEHGRVTAVSGMAERTLVGQPRAVVLQVEVVVQDVMPPAQESQTTTYTTTAHVSIVLRAT